MRHGVLVNWERTDPLCEGHSSNTKWLFIACVTMCLRDQEWYHMWPTTVMLIATWAGHRSHFDRPLSMWQTSSWHYLKGCECCVQLTLHMWGSQRPPRHSPKCFESWEPDLTFTFWCTCDMHGSDAANVCIIQCKQVWPSLFPNTGLFPMCLPLDIYNKDF